MGKKNSTSDDADATEAKKPVTVKLASVVLCIGLAGGGYLLGGRSASASPNEAESAPTTTIPSEDGCEKPAEEGSHPTIVDLPSMSVNLAEGHYLRIAVALGLCTGVGESSGGGHGAEESDAPAIATAPAQDIVLEALSGASMEELATEEGRAEAKESLTEHIRDAYPGTVAEVFFVEFVMQ